MVLQRREEMAYKDSYAGYNGAQEVGVEKLEEGPFSSTRLPDAPVDELDLVFFLPDLPSLSTPHLLSPGLRPPLPHFRSSSRPGTRSSSSTTRRSLSDPSCSRACLTVSLPLSLSLRFSSCLHIHLLIMRPCFWSGSTDLGGMPEQAISLPNITANVFKKFRAPPTPHLNLSSWKFRPEISLYHVSYRS
jgi:hypothetical protein